MIATSLLLFSVRLNSPATFLVCAATSLLRVLSTFSSLKYLSFLPANPQHSTAPFSARSENMDWLRTTPAIYSSYLVNSDFVKQKTVFGTSPNTNIQRPWYSDSVLNQCEVTTGSGFPMPTYSPNAGMSFCFLVDSVSPHSYGLTNSSRSSSIFSRRTLVSVYEEARQSQVADRTIGYNYKLIFMASSPSERRRTMSLRCQSTTSNDIMRNGFSRRRLFLENGYLLLCSVDPKLSDADEQRMSRQE